jgi:5-methylcytosine-specific restriction endonuclease McrA
VDQARSELKKIVVIDRKGHLYLNSGTFYYIITSIYSGKKLIDNVVKCFTVLKIFYREDVVHYAGYDQINLRTLKSDNKYMDLAARYSKKWRTIFIDYSVRKDNTPSQPKSIKEQKIVLSKRIEIVKIVAHSICPVCLSKKANSEHHIVPRSAGGSDNPRNKVLLCDSCHDIVELLYDEFGLTYSPDLVTKIRLNYLNVKTVPLQYLEVHVNEN